jgi:anti-sigma regulatory factor (Ser/Thr protein kinase)
MLQPLRAALATRRNLARARSESEAPRVESLLVDLWLDGNDDAFRILDEASISLARQRAREVAGEVGLSSDDGARLAVIASELGHNQLRHGRDGRLAVRPIARGPHRGVEIIAADRGPGIGDPAAALAGAPRAHGSLGFGLASVAQLADELDVDVRLREGTCVRARKLAAGAPRHPQIGIYGRPILGEAKSGDHALVRRTAAAVSIGVCDGLGHGRDARDAADVAIAAFDSHAHRTPAAVLEACHGAVESTRGAVMAVARMEVPRRGVEVASVGNIVSEVVGPRASTRFGSTAHVLGTPRRGLRISTETRPIEPGELLLLFSDGVSARASIHDDLALLRQHPVVIAREVLKRFGRDHDDALVAVVH